MRQGHPPLQGETDTFGPNDQRHGLLQALKQPRTTLETDRRKFSQSPSHSAHRASHGFTQRGAPAGMAHRLGLRRVVSPVPCGRMTRFGSGCPVVFQDEPADGTCAATSLAAISRQIDQFAKRQALAQANVLQRIP
jgi:hypothetical protein